MPVANGRGKLSRTASGNGTITVAQQPDDKQIELYLIGALPEDETERFDEMSLTDDAFANRLRDVENDLVDAYARGGLSGTLAEGFKAHYLASPRRREKVRFARALVTLGVASEPAGTKTELAGRAAGSVPGSTPQPWPAGPTRQRRIVWALAMAAAVLLAVAGYLGLEDRKLERQMSQARQERAALAQREQELSRELADDNAEAARRADELAAIRERMSQLEKQLASEHRTGTEDRAHPALVAFNLPAPTRGATSIPALGMQQGSGVAFTLELEADDFSGYQATLKDSGSDHTIWKSGPLKPLAKNQKRVISFKLQSGLLRQGVYDVEVAGQRKRGGLEIVGNYPFKVVIQ